MKIALSARGSRGDVYPILGIARALQEAGHEVALCLAPSFVQSAAQHGLTVQRCYAEDAPDLMREMGRGAPLWRELTWLPKTFTEQLILLREISEGADALVTTINELASASVAQSRGIPHYRVTYAPFIPGSGPVPLFPWQHLPASVNRALWRALNAATAQVVGGPLNKARAAVGLPPTGPIGEHLAMSSHTLLAVDPALAPPASDWRYPFSYVGCCHCVDGELDDDLLRFLDEGPPPVYIGFGSVILRRPEQITRLIISAVQRAGCRAIVGSGWTGLGSESIPEQIRLVSETPHASLFPRVAAVVHHGGSGTTQIAAASGVPQLVIPQIADQFYWGNRVADLGLGPKPRLPLTLTARGLAAALRELVDGTYRQRAADFARQLPPQSGNAQAASIIGCRAAPTGAPKDFRSVYSVATA